MQTLPQGPLTEHEVIFENDQRQRHHNQTTKTTHTYTHKQWAVYFFSTSDLLASLTPFVHSSQSHFSSVLKHGTCRSVCMCETLTFSLFIARALV